MEDLFTRNESGQSPYGAKRGLPSSIRTLQSLSFAIFRSPAAFRDGEELVKEVTIRKKDEEANRFTRHEVKNGILAAMGLLDHLRESMAQSNVEEANSEADLPSVLERTMSSSDELAPAAAIDLEAPLTKLKTLSLTSWTPFSMRPWLEIVYGEYEPKMERLMSLLYLPLFGGDLAGIPL
jgi:hypothetical protein